MSPSPPATIAAVVLAAGGARRFGSAKQVALAGDEPMVRRAARCALDAGAAPVFVVVGAAAAEVRAALAGLDVVEVPNAQWDSGLASSVAAGIDAAIRLAPDATGVLLMAADQPLVDAAAIRRLIDVFPGRDGVVAAAYDGGGGVPAIVGADHLGSLSTLTGDRGAGAWLRANARLVVTVALEGATDDVDTAADLERVRTRLGAPRA